MRHVCSPFVALIILIAPAASSAQARDSAGVRIVTLRLSSPLPRAPMALASAPSLVLGETAGGPEYEFTDVPAAVRLADRTIVVVNRATNELRFFDEHGRFLRAAGRRGKGPGEFTSIAAFALLPGDSMLVQDFSTSRVAVFSAEGKLVRTFTLGPAPNRPRGALVGAFRDQTLLGAGSDYLTNVEPPLGVFTLTQTLFAFSATGTPIHPLGSLVERQFLFVAGPSGNSRYVLPFGRLGTIRVNGEAYLTGDGSTFEIREHTQDGRLSRIVRAAVKPRRVSEKDKAAEKRRILAFYGQETTTVAFERFWGAVPWPDRLPAFRRFEVDAAGRLWIELFAAADDPPGWLVLDAARRVLGFVAIPERFEIRHILSDGVLGVRRNADDVEQVEFYSFTQHK